jgi:uncharacterized alkaline shock family protein YloU
MADTTATPKTVATTTPTTIPTDGGKTVIDDSVVAKVAGIAAREVSGVHALGGGAARAIGAIRNAIGNQDHGQGVKVEVGERQVAADVTIVADYPVSLQDVAERVRKSVGTAIEQIIGMEVAEINVTIQDVYIPEDDDDNKAEESRVA